MKMFLFFSHELTSEQIEDAKKNLGVDEFVKLDENLQNILSNIPPDIDDLSEYIKPLINFLFEKAKKGDYVLIQGEFGAVYKIVSFCKVIGLIPIYSTTKRVAVEEKKDGKIIKKSIFKHVRFRKY